MPGLPQWSARGRIGWGAVLALLLALRLLSPAGFMPSWDAGHLAIVACDGLVVPTAPQIATDHPGSGHGHKDDHKSQQHPCPYAFAASQSLLGTDGPLLLVVALFTAFLLLGRTFVFLERQRRRDRPPLRGPPAIA
jgi:hypothetical protein